MTRPTILIACHLRDARDWMGANHPDSVVVVTPRSINGARGFNADSVAWTRGALRLPQETRDQMWHEVAPCFLA